MKKIHVSQDDIITAVRKYSLRAFDKLRAACIRQDAVPHRGEESVVFRSNGRLDDEFGYGIVKIYQDNDLKRKRHYQEIIPRLKNIESPHLLPVQFYGRDFLMAGKDGTSVHLPVLAMNWAGGSCTLDEFVRAHLHEQNALEALLYQFAQLCIWLDKQPFTHGNLRSDNILFQRHAPMALVDYDTLCFKELNPATYKPSVDDCHMAAIGLSLCLVCADYTLWDKYYKPEDGLLLFSENDCRKGVKNLPQLDKVQRLKERYPLLEKYEDLFRQTMHDRQFCRLGMEAFVGTPESLYTDGKTDSTFKEPMFTDVREPCWDAYIGYSYDKVYLFTDNGFFLPVYKVKEGTQVICDLAFTDTDIRKLILPYSLRYIGYGAFSYSKIEEIVCHSPHFKVENGAVYNAGMTRLESCFTHERVFTVPSSVKEIAAGAFYCNNYVEKVVLPEGLRVIPAGAFYGCEKLKVVKIPDSVVEIGEEAFYNTGSLTQVALTNVTKFGRLCFESSGLESVTIPEGTEILPEEAFFGCIKLKEVHLPDTLKVIGNSAFSNCHQLKTIVLPENVRKIEWAAFYHSTSLEKVVFPKRPPVVADNAFEETPVKQIPRQKENKEPDNGPEWEFNEDKTMLIRCRSKADTLVIDEGIKIIDESALAGLPARRIQLPASLDCIREEAFAGCRNLETIDLPEGIVSIEEGAFSGCTALKQVKTPSSLLRLGEYAFEECTALREAVIDGKLTTIGKDTFRDCCLLDKVIFPKTLACITEEPFERCFSLRSVLLPLHTTMNLYIFPDGCRLSFYPSPEENTFRYELTNLSKGFLKQQEDVWIMSPVEGHAFPAYITPYAVAEGFKGNLYFSIAEKPEFLNRGTVRPSLMMGEEGVERVREWVKKYRKELLKIWRGTLTVAEFRRQLNPEAEKERLREKALSEFPEINEDDFYPLPPVPDNEE